MTTLEHKRDQLRRIFRGQESYGEGNAAEQAQRYRLQEMYADAVASALRNSAGVERPAVDLLISLSGFSPETTLLAFELIQPPRILIISSRNTEVHTNLIWEKLAGRLAFSQVKLMTCNPVDPIDIYEIVKKAVRPERAGDPPLRAIIDITGGKKVMSAGAALAAAQLDLPMCYVDSDFDAEMRQALPGSERLCVLSNPTKLFGDKDMAAAMAMFRTGGYSGARARFAELSASMSEPAKARFLGDLSALYQAWCDLDVVSLPDLVTQVRRRLEDPRSELRTETMGRLGEQLRFVESLVKRDPIALLLNFFLLGEHYLGQERYDFAALLFYRTIEKALSERLRLVHGRFELDRPDYAVLGVEPAELSRRYGEISKQIYGVKRTELPWKVALVDAAVLLHVLDDGMVREAKMAGVKAIGSLRNLVEGRNRSVLAHGTESVTSAQCQDLRSRATVLLRAFWKTHGYDRDLDQYVATLRFVAEA